MAILSWKYTIRNMNQNCDEFSWAMLWVFLVICRIFTAEPLWVNILKNGKFVLDEIMFSFLTKFSTLMQKKKNWIYSHSQLCNKYLPRIVGGEIAKLENFKWKAALLEESKFFCGGTIFAPTKILTAAHCTNDFNLFQ